MTPLNNPLQQNATEAKVSEDPASVPRYRDWIFFVCVFVLAFLYLLLLSHSA